MTKMTIRVTTIRHRLLKQRGATPRDAMEVAWKSHWWKESMVFKPYVDSRWWVWDEVEETEEALEPERERYL